jgi:hypothetical protein
MGRSPHRLTRGLKLLPNIGQHSVEVPRYHHEGVERVDGLIAVLTLYSAVGNGIDDAAVIAFLARMFSPSRRDADAIEFNHVVKVRSGSFALIQNAFVVHVFLPSVSGRKLPRIVAVSGADYRIKP